MSNKKEEQLYLKEDLIKHSKELTGYSEDVAIGALLSCKKNELSIDEFNTEIKTFLKKEVK